MKVDLVTRFVTLTALERANPPGFVYLVVQHSGIDQSGMNNGQDASAS